MYQFCQSVLDFLGDEEGATAMEYALVLSLILVICFSVISALGRNTQKTYSNLSKAIDPPGKK